MRALRVLLLVAAALCLAVIGVWTDAQGTEHDVAKVWTLIIGALLLFWAAIAYLIWEVF